MTRDRSPEDQLTSRVEREGIAALEPDPPRRPVWCPVCQATIIDPAIERCCVECETVQRFDDMVNGYGR